MLNSKICREFGRFYLSGHNPINSLTLKGWNQPLNPKAMKKTLLLLLAISSIAMYGQKKKTKTATAPKKTALASIDNISAELSERKDSYRFYTLAGKDTLFAKTIAKKNGAPTDVKILPFTAGTSKLHSVVWNEKKTVGDAKSKLENITETHTEIWNIQSKTKVFENVQSVNNITEIVWLDPNKTASKTVEKIKRDGMECTIDKNCEVTLKNKTQQTKYTYDQASQKFVVKK